MPAIRTPKKKKEAPKPKVSSRQVVSAYSEEGQSRIHEGERQTRRLRIVFLLVLLTLFAAAAVVTFCIAMGWIQLF